MKMAEKLGKLLKKTEFMLKKIGRTAAKQAAAIRCAGRWYAKTASNSIRKGWKTASGYKDVIGYYSVLAIVLVALSAAAYDYRGKKNEKSVIDAQTAPETGVTVQMQSDPTLPPETASFEYVLPVRGKVIGHFADHELVWSTTLQLWQTHPALDIAASMGEAVVAAADGKITEAYSDALYGNTIVIDHGSDRIVRYASLNTLELVEIGQIVEKGEIIGSVGTCAAEAELGAHVHLESIVGNVMEDFSLLLSENDRENLLD